MLGLKGIKGSLDAGADADLVIFSEEIDDDDSTPGAPRLAIDEVWKFGSRVYHKSEPFSPVYSPVEGGSLPTTGTCSPEPGFL